ncbi:MAG: hypothetical protein QM761_07035 [Pseudoxanthomonas sp.]
MKTRRLQTWHLLAGAGALCGLALLPVDLRPAEAGTMASAGDGSQMIQAADELAASTPHRLRHRYSALTMPYFSFARSLRPGN